GGGEVGSYGTVGFGRNIVPTVRLNIGKDTEVNTNEVALPTQSVKAFPNPADTYTNVELDFETASDVKLTVLDIKGRILEQRELAGIQSTRLTLDTKDYPSGEYLIRVSTQDGVANRRVTVQH
ncbi:MAG: T9SS type A sorting domain-containing protein, partial [Bacteroidota bacterium]